MRATQFYVLPYNCSEIEVFDIQRVLLDEFAARLNDIAHQFGEQIIRFGHIRYFDLQERARIRVQRGFPKLLGVHFTQAFVALQGQAFFAFGQDRVQQIKRAVNALVAVFAHQGCRQIIHVLQMVGERPRTPRLARAQHLAVQGAYFRDPG
jgi:hypothetical protein